MIYVAMTDYSDSRNETLYAGENLEAALHAVCKHHSWTWRIEKWINNEKVWEVKK